MWPILVAPPAFPFVVETYPVLLAAAVVSGVGLAVVLLRRWTTIPPWRAAAALGLLTTAGLAGGRVHFLVANRALLPADWPVGRLWDGGFHAGGAVLAVALTSLAVTPLLRLPLGAFADAIAPAAALAMAIHRVACFLRGCCLGALCAQPWCVRYPRRSFAFLLHVHTGVIPGSAPASAPVHPLPLYYVGLALLVLVFALWRQPRRRYPGEVAALSLAFFAAGTWHLERFRMVTKHTVFIGAWPQLTAAGALLTALSLVVLAVAELRARARCSRNLP